LSAPVTGAMLKEVPMATLEERVAFLEGQVSEHTQTLIDIRDSIRQLESRVDVRFDAVDRRFGALDDKFDRRFGALEDKFDRRFGELEDKFDRRLGALEDKSDRRAESLEDKMSRQFAWLVGIQVTTLVAIVGALLSRA
jgi:hypothetical protein